jgi:hypothetical protein
MSIPTKETQDWARTLQQIDVNPFLQEDSTNTSLQPGEAYPNAPHPFMIKAYKQYDATMNQITQLIEANIDAVPERHRAAVRAQKLTKEHKWLYPYTVENPCGTVRYNHWKANFNLAVIQIVSSQFKQEHRITKDGADLYSQGTASFTDGAEYAVSAKSLQVCQPLLLNHMYYCRNRTLVEVDEFARLQRPDLQLLIDGGDRGHQARAEQHMQRYQTGILSQLQELQTVCSHTAQLFLATLIPGAKDDTSPLFIALRNHRQEHYETQQSIDDVTQRVPYGMHHIFKHIADTTVRDDAVSRHVIEHTMLWATRQPGINIHAWSLSFKTDINRRRHAMIPPTDMTMADEHMFVKNIFASQLTATELETIAAISDGDFARLSEGIFDMPALQALLARNMSRFVRTFKSDKRVNLFITNRYTRMTEDDKVLDKLKGKDRDPGIKRKRTAPPEARKERHTKPSFKRRVPRTREVFLGTIQTRDYCKTPRCVETKKQHTHTTADCGIAKSQQRSLSNGFPPRNPRSLGGPAKKDDGCFHCGGDHFQRNCEKFTKLKASKAFMAIMSDFKPTELKHLNTLICSTNRPVCKRCLESECDGDCSPDDPDMASAKQRFFTNGAYEHVLANKEDRDIQPDAFAHSPFSRDSYLSTQREEYEGAADQGHNDEQERICIMDGHVDDTPPLDDVLDNESEASSVDEDGGN